MNTAEMVSDAAKAAPPITVTSMSLMGFPISDWAFLLTAIYTALLIISLARKLIMNHRASDRTCSISNCPVRKKKE